MIQNILSLLLLKLLADTPLEASRGTGRREKSQPHPILNLSFKRVKKKYFWGEGGVEPSKKKLKTFQGPRNKKLHCKGEQYQFSG